MSAPQAAGRLGDPAMSLATEPRLHPKLREALKALGMDQIPPPLQVTTDSPFEAVRAWTAQDEDALEALYGSVELDIPGPTSAVKLTTTDKVIPGPEGTQLKLTIRKPADARGSQLPALLYIHGGGMTKGFTDNPPHSAWAASLARTGLLVVTVHFRNAYAKTGDNPYPAGLNDCAAAVRWVDEHCSDLGISKLVVQGESGGANLSMATALKAKREGWIKAIDGVVGWIPFISGAYGMPKEWLARELPSLVECDGYYLGATAMALTAQMYDPTGKHAKDPLAWPYWADEDDLRGLPPHLIVTSELDPLRDEGNAYFRKLVKAGVRAAGIVTLGTIHTTELLFRQAMPEAFEHSMREIKSFVDSL